jgi:putative Mn2+ efflux pump MntP
MSLSHNMMLTLFFQAFTVGLILSADSFSAALAMGNRPFTKSLALKFALISGGSEAVVAFLGSISGSFVIKYFSSIDHWIAFILLGLVAVHMFYEGLKELFFETQESEENKKKTEKSSHSLFKIVLVSLATSMDAFAVGMGLGVAQKPMPLFVFFIGLWAFSTTLLGLYLAKKLSHHFGSYMNLIGGIILSVMALAMLKI